MRNLQPDFSDRFSTLMGPQNAIGLLDDIDQSISDKCFSSPICDSAPYRTMSGVCNNLQFPVWGQAGTSIIRIIQAEYADGTSTKDNRNVALVKKLPWEPIETHFICDLLTLKTYILNLMYNS